MNPEHTAKHCETAATRLAELAETIDTYMADGGYLPEDAADIRAVLAELAQLRRDRDRLQEALRLAITYLDATAPTPYTEHVCGPDSGCDGNCADVANHYEMMRPLRAAIDDARSARDAATATAAQQAKATGETEAPRLGGTKYCEKCHGYHGSIKCHTPEQRGEAEPKYACERCGKLRTAAEGGTTFTVCDECWDHPAPAERKGAK